jgi:hypothetical protein
MIKSEVGFRQCLQIIADMYQSLAELHQQVAPLNFKNYQIFAEGPIEEIRRAQSDINEYLGISEQFTCATSATASPVLESSNDAVGSDHLPASNSQ